MKYLKVNTIKGWACKKPVDDFGTEFGFSCIMWGLPFLCSTEAREEKRATGECEGEDTCRWVKLTLETTTTEDEFLEDIE